MEKPWLKFYDKGVPANLDYPDIAVWEIAKRSAEKYTNHPALVFQGETITYTQLWDNIHACARMLQDIGVKKGDRVAVMLPNIPQYVMAFYGISLAGATVVGINPLFTSRELKQILIDCGAETLMIFNLMFGQYKQIAKESPVQKVIVAGVDEYLPPGVREQYIAKCREEGKWCDVKPADNLWFFNELLVTVSGAPKPVELDAREDVAFIQYTSGTTGLPKGVVLTHRNLVANCYQLRNWTPSLVEKGEVVIGVLPFFHLYGLSVTLNLGIMLGSTIILHPRFDPHEVLQSIETHKVTVFQGVPTMYTALNAVPDIDRYDFSSIRFCNSGAAPLPLDVLERFEKLTGTRIIEGYGLSEASPVTHSIPTSGLRKRGTVGIPMPDIDCKIVNENGDRLRPDEVGEIVVRGPNIMPGYWNKAKETASTLREGWLFTGDLGKMDEDGYLTIVDRKKDMVIVGGYNVYPREVEEVLYEHPEVQEVIVAGVPDAYHGEIIKAYIVLAQDTSITEDEIMAFCKERLVHYKRPKKIEFRDTLPKSTVGKLLRRVVVEEEKTS